MKQTAKGKENKWREFLRTCDYRTGARKFWKVVRSLNGSKPVAGRHPITFGSKPIHSPRDITSSFNKQFTNARPHASDKLLRITRRKIAKLPLSDSPIFTPENTKQAIADSKPSRALGPDGLCNIHLKHLGPLATQYLTYLFNISLSENTIPQIWKNSKIALLPKPNKDLKQSTSYRPISLLCPAVKILERLVHPIFTKHLPNANTNTASALFTPPPQLSPLSNFTFQTVLNKIAPLNVRYWPHLTYLRLSTWCVIAHLWNSFMTLPSQEV